MFADINEPVYLEVGNYVMLYGRVFRVEEVVLKHNEPDTVRMVPAEELMVRELKDAPEGVMIAVEPGETPEEAARRFGFKN